MPVALAGSIDDMKNNVAPVATVENNTAPSETFSSTVTVPGRLVN